MARSTAQRNCSSLNVTWLDVLAALTSGVMAANGGNRTDDGVKVDADSSRNSMDRTDVASKMSDSSAEAANLIF